MGIVKEYSAKFHLGVLEAVILVFVILIWLSGFYEAYFLTKVQAKIYGEAPTIWDWIANAIPVVLGSLSAMSLPPFISHCKTKLSIGGTEIAPIEGIMILMLILMSIIAPMWMYFKCEEALNIALEKKIFDNSQYTLRLDTITGTIILNGITDILLGIWSIYEVQQSSGNVKTIRLGKKSKATIIPITSIVPVKTKQEVEEEVEVEEKEVEEKDDKNKKPIITPPPKK